MTTNDPNHNAEEVASDEAAAASASISAAAATNKRRLEALGGSKNKRAIRSTNTHTHTGGEFGCKPKSLSIIVTIK